MKNILNVVNRPLKLLIARFPARLPTGRGEFDKFISSIFSLYNLPTDSTYINAVATMIMHLSPTADKKSKYFFARSVRKAMANQIAFNVIDEIREADKKKREVTHNPENGEPLLEQSREQPLQDKTV